MVVVADTLVPGPNLNEAPHDVEEDKSGMATVASAGAVAIAATGENPDPGDTGHATISDNTETLHPATPVDNAADETTSSAAERPADQTKRVATPAKPSSSSHRKNAAVNTRRHTQRQNDEEPDSVGRYLQEIGQHPLLDKADEVRLAKAMEAGREAAKRLKHPELLDASTASRLRQVKISGEEAKQKFINSNLRLVVSIARKYQSSGLPLLDLIQEGNIGMMHAVVKFDWRRGFKFSTYGTWWIHQAITRGIANTGRSIRLPVHAVETLRKIRKEKALLERELGREPTLDEIAVNLSTNLEKIKELMAVRGDPISLSTPLNDDGSVLGDVVEDRTAESPLDAAVRSMAPQEMAKLLNRLQEREREILRLRFGLDRGEPRTLEEVGRHFGLTRERIRQIEGRALSKLRHPSNEDL